MIAVRDAFRTIDGTSEFFNDLSGTTIVQLGREAPQSLLEGKDAIAVRILDGLDNQPFRNTGSTISAQFEIVALVLIRDTVGTLIERMADFIADVELAIPRCMSLGGTCTDFQIKSIDPPDYHFDRAVVTTTIRFASTYDYEAGIDR